MPTKPTMSPSQRIETLGMVSSLPTTHHSQRRELQETALHVLDGPHQGKSMPLLADEMIVGRSEALSDFALPEDPNVSATHASLRIESGLDGQDAVLLQDLDSRNGTFVQGVRIREAFLQPGDRVRLGHTTFALEISPQTRKVELQYTDQSGLLVGQSRQMRGLFSNLRRLGTRDVPVLLAGETGTGKTHIARALHRQSQRASRPFVHVNCGAISPSLIESSLFGHEKGAFTGAHQRHQGYFERADGGTLFLDEIGELPLEVQPKLLDVLESKRLTRLGGGQELHCDFRLLAATHRDLPKAVKEGQFREDLFYRLSVIQLQIPPLRERLEDLPLLVDTLLEQLFPDAVFKLDQGALDKLGSYIWPGNVRELRNVLERTFLFADSPIATAQDIVLPQSEDASEEEPPLGEPLDRAPDGAITVPFAMTDAGISAKALLASVERALIERTLEYTGGHVQKAAVLLDMAQSWLYKRIKQYGIKK